jgi:hypothetical protein
MKFVPKRFNEEIRYERRVEVGEKGYNQVYAQCYTFVTDRC